MKEKKILTIIDRIVWWFIALFPLLILCFSAINHNLISISDVLTTLGFNVTNSNVIYSAISDLFGSASEFLPIFASADFIAFATYFVTINLVHLVIDMLLFLVDICHDLLKGVFRK